MDAFLVTGIPGAGKTTTARALATRFARGVHIEGDVISFEFVVSGVADPFGDDANRAEWDAQMHLRRAGMCDLANRYSDAGFTCVLDDVVVNRDVLAEIERQLRVALRVVVLAPPIDEVGRRDAGRDKHVFDQWRHLNAELRSELDGIGLWITDGAQSVDEVVDHIVSSNP